MSQYSYEQYSHSEEPCGEIYDREKVELASQLIGHQPSLEAHTLDNRKKSQANRGA